MKTRYWFLAIGTVIAFVALFAHHPTDLVDLALLFAGGLIGIWASEGVNARARERGVTLDPL